MSLRIDLRGHVPYLELIRFLVEEHRSPVGLNGPSFARCVADDDGISRIALEGMKNSADTPSRGDDEIVDEQLFLVSDLKNARKRPILLAAAAHDGANKIVGRRGFIIDGGLRLSHS